jgi:hypothetical protein
MGGSGDALGAGTAALLPCTTSGREPRQHRNAGIHQACRVSRDHMPVVHGHHGRRAPRAALQSPLPQPLATKQEETGEEVQPGHAGAGGLECSLGCRCVLMPSTRVSRWTSESLIAVRNGTVNMTR